MCTLVTMLSPIVTRSSMSNYDALEKMVTWAGVKRIEEPAFEVWWFHQ